MVRSGTTVTFQVEGRTGGIFRPEAGALRSSVIAFLSQWFTVKALELNIRTLVGSITSGELWNYDYTAIVVVTTRMDYGHVDDVGSVVAHAFYTAGGALPTVTPDLHDGPFGGVGSTGPSVGDALADVGQELANIPRLLVFGIIAVVAIVAFSPAGKAGLKVSAL